MYPDGNPIPEMEYFKHNYSFFKKIENKDYDIFPAGVTIKENEEDELKEYLFEAYPEEDKTAFERGIRLHHFVNKRV